MINIKVTEEAFEFLAYLARQDITLPALLVDYLKWDYSTEQIKGLLNILDSACIEARSNKRFSGEVSTKNRALRHEFSNPSR
jgi:hypothetical protein